jgi:hypothetical protein
MMTVDVVGGAEDLSDATGERAGLMWIASWTQDGELVTAEPSDFVGST